MPKYEKIIYIAGPYMSDDLFKIDENIIKAARIALEVWKRGYVALCPHKNTSNFERFEGEGKIPQEAWYKGDITLLSKCDGMILIPGWQSSKGTLKEKKYAEEHNIPVYEHLYQLPEVE